MNIANFAELTASNASGLHVVQYFPSAVAAREREDRGAQGWVERVERRNVTAAEMSERARHVVQPISKTVACHISSHRTWDIGMSV